MRPGSSDPLAETAAYFERTTLDHPWADPEIPSLVFVNRGAVEAFVGSYVCRMRFEGQPIRAACPGSLVAAPEVRNQAAGALLLRQYMNGPQDVTFTDTAGEPVRRMWERLGGEIAHVGALSWARIFRPCGLARERLLERRGGRASRALLPPLCAAVDAVALRLSRGALKPAPSPASAEALTPEAMLRELPRLTASLRLYPAYDDEYLEWLFEELSRPRRRGTLVRHLVRDADRVLGWYVYYLKPGGISRVLQVVGSDKDVGSVLDHLFHDAERRGAARPCSTGASSHGCWSHSRGGVAGSGTRAHPPCTRATR